MSNLTQILQYVDRRITERLLQFQRGASGAPTMGGGIPSSLPPNGAAGGDLAGEYPSPIVARVQGFAIADTAPANGQVLTWVDGNSQYEPQTPSGGSSAVAREPVTNGDATNPEILFVNGDIVMMEVI